MHTTGLSGRFLLVAGSGLGALRLLFLLRVYARSALPADGRSVRRFLHRTHPGRWRSTLGLRCARGKPAASGYLRGGDWDGGVVPGSSPPYRSEHKAAPPRCGWRHPASTVDAVTLAIAS